MNCREGNVSEKPVLHFEMFPSDGKSSFFLCFFSFFLSFLKPVLSQLATVESFIAFLLA